MPPILNCKQNAFSGITPARLKIFTEVIVRVRASMVRSDYSVKVPLFSICHLISAKRQLSCSSSHRHQPIIRTTQSSGMTESNFAKKRSGFLFSRASFCERHHCDISYRIVRGTASLLNSSESAACLLNDTHERITTLVDLYSAPLHSSIAMQTSLELS